MVDWELVLRYTPDIEEIADKISRKYDTSLRDDAVQYTRIILKQKLNVQAATGPEREYVRGAIWKIIHEFFKSHTDWQFLSLDRLLEKGLQIDPDGDPIWPGLGGSYTGHYREEEDER